jgi:signal transduction histidine kinase/CHASE1-domain containing sensor protein
MINNIQLEATASPGNFVTMLCVASMVYLALGVLGINFAIDPGYASPIFPAAGFAVAFLLWSGKRSWPAIWVGSFVLNLNIAWLHGDLGWRSAALGAGIATACTLQALAARWLVVRGIKDGWQTLEEERAIVRCLALAGPLACLMASSIAVPLLYWAQLVPAAGCLYAWWNWWFGDMMGVLVFLPLSLAIFHHRQPLWRGRLMTLILPMLIALGLVGVAFVVSAKWERSQEKQDISRHGEDMAQLLAQRFIAHQEALSALRRLLEVTPDMDYSQFEYFTRITLKDNPDIFALSINPYVLAPQRQAFEREMAHRAAVNKFEIKERDSHRRLVRAADRPDYVAVGLIAPLEGNLPAIGFDINSEPVRHDAIDRAKLSAAPAVTAPVQLVQENKKRVGLLLLHPAYERNQYADTDKNALMGFAVGVIKVDHMVEIATHAVVNPELVFRIDDMLMPAEKSLLYHSNPSVSPPKNYYIWQKEVLMADRPWRLSVFPTAQFLAQRSHLATLLVGAGGLALAVLLQVLLLVATGKTAVVQRKVREQTAQLQVSSNALEDQNAQLNALFTLSPDGFVAFSSDAKVKFVNPAFLAMTGFNQNDVVGWEEAVLDAEFRKRCESKATFMGIASCFQDFGAPLKPQTFELKIPRPTVLQMVGIHSQSSSVSRILYLRDVSHETEVERMKSEFLSTAAHELRTPMASIYGFAEVLMTQDVDNLSKKEMLGIIYRQSGLMSSILNELLDLARIEARRGKDFTFENVSVQNLVAEVVHEFKLPRGRSAPTLTASGTPLTVLADHKKAQQAILNILSNAYKYSPAGGDVHIELIESLQNGAIPPRVGIRISDHGIGMTQEQQGRVFERFYRADASGKISGTGLGMSIVHEIVECHGGTVELSSEYGVGTTVTVWLLSRQVVPTDVDQHPG